MALVTLSERNKKWHQVATLRQNGAGLTPRQLELFLFIFGYTKRTGMCPTNREMREAIGYRTPSGVSNLLDRIEKSKLITRVVGLKHNVVVTNKGVRLARKYVKATKG
jgi:SOS-response transcriptional repressor LexA